MAPVPANYDEALVPAYELPDLLGGVDAAGWLARRETLLETFRATVYGRSPTSGWELRALCERSQEGIWNGLADRSEIVATLRGPCGERSFRILLHLPHAVGGPLPLQLGLNFAGNHTVVTDPWPTLTPAWLPAREAARMVPARGLRTGDEADAFQAPPRWGTTLTLLVVAVLLCFLPPLDGLPLGGYLAVALVGIRLLVRLINPDLVLPEWAVLLSVAVIFAWGFSARNDPPTPDAPVAGSAFAPEVPAQGAPPLPGTGAVAEVSQVD
jgi:hypothetical protein